MGITTDTDITSGKMIYRNFTKYVALNIFSMIGLSCYILADTVFIANGVGSNGLTALNLVLPIYSFMNGIGLMIGIGAATQFSISYGEKNIAEGNKIFTIACVIAGFLGILFTITGIFFSNRLAGFLGADYLILPIASEYLRTILLFSPAFMLNNVLICFVRNDGKPTHSMTAMLVGSFSNVILDYVFIFPLGLGMFGAAFATGLAPIFSMAVLSLHFINKKNSFKLVKLHTLKQHLDKIFKSGISSFITEFSSGIVMLLFNFTILKIAGNPGVAAYGVIANLALIVVAIFTGIAQGIQPIVSQNYGAGKTSNTIKTLFLALILAESLGFILYIIMVFFHIPVISIFNKNNDPLLRELAANGILLYFISFLLMGINIVTASFFSAVTQAKQSFVIAFTRGFAAVILLINILPHFMGMNGVWITIPCVELITLFFSVISIKCYLTSIRKNTVSNP